MTKPTSMTIDIFSDVMCPWCLIGYGQLSKALEALDGEVEAQLRWRPFELNPQMSVEGEEQDAHLAKKYQRSDDGASNLRDDIAHGLWHGHPPCGHGAQRHRRIDVTARDRPDAVGHTDEGKTKGKADPHQTDIGPRDHSRSASQQHQRERPDKLCNLFL